MYDRLKPKPFTLTTYSTFFHPRDTFALVHAHNDRHRDSPKLQFDIEVYNPLSWLGVAQDLSLPTNPAVTARRIARWQKEYPLTRVARVHDAFSYDWYDAWYRLIKGEPWDKKPSHIAGTLLWGVANQGNSIQLVRQLEDQGTALSIHGNLALGYQKDGLLPGIIHQVPKVLLEVEKSVGTPYGDDQNRSVTDPSALVDRIIVSSSDINKLGLILSPDHQLEQEVAVIDELERQLSQPQVSQFCEGVHLSGESHSLFRLEDPTHQALLRMLTRTPFERFVQLTLDANGRAYSAMSFSQQLDYLESFARAADGLKTN